MLLAHFHYLPLAMHSYSIALITSVLYGATLAGFVPMAALMPTMAPDRRGAAMAALDLGAGLATAVARRSSGSCCRCSASAA
ncbi:hypothetical protein AB0I53_42900 [Saccharopolyspora sp. NPDC050389]|uniref:hypothetical protein n=1 Tax=Saccharopolyspora sp. NPDC050389 TaxID=3155516 RepID=UPI0033FFD7C9